MAGFAAVTGSASAKIELSMFDAGPVGPAATQAGGHADISTVFVSTTDPNPSGPLPIPQPYETPKSVTVDLPAGFAGNPTAAPHCTRTQLGAGQCPTASQVGVAQLIVEPTGPSNASSLYGVYLLEPQGGHTAEFGFSVAGIANVLAVATVRSGGDYGLHVELKNLPAEALPATFGTALTLWGVPADPIHDTERTVPGDTYVTGAANPAGVPPVPFLSNPTRCTGEPLTTTIAIDSWQDAGQLTHATSESPPLSGCDALNFEPALTLQPDSPRAGEPAGYNVELTVPQTSDPAIPATAHVKDVTVKLPQGVAVSPSSADHLEGCSDAQAGIGSADPAACPAASKIGNLEISTPLLDNPLTGSIYLGTPKSSDAQTGEMLRLVLVAQGSGVRVKLQGNITPDPVTGQLKVTFINNPQLPFDKLKLQFQGGVRAPLTNPQLCGSFATETVFTSWGGQAKTSTDTMQVTQNAAGGPCASLGFAPSFLAGTLSPVAGAFSPFSMTIAREDGDQDLSAIDVALPAGLLAKVAGTAQCAESAAAAGSCPAGSRIGSTTVAAGAGASPFSLPGDVYLTGPYKGAPFGLSIVVAAKAGPFDLGTVVVRAAVRIDPLDAHVSVTADPLPQILQGIPLRLRKINVTVDKPGFTTNPTSCAPKAIDGALGSAAGATAAVTAPFQADQCAALRLKPSLALTLSGKGQTTDGKHPAVTANLTQSAGQANLKKVRVALPLSLALDPDNATGLCEFVDGSKAEPTCPKASIVGAATATSPILDEPLSGPVYFVKNVRKDPKSGRDIKTLPKLVIPLVGQNGVKLTLAGTSAVDDDQLVTTFDNIPDAPVSSFKLNIIGGKGGILTVSDADICKATQVAKQRVDGQNGKAADADVYIQTPSCPTKIISKTIGKTTVKLKVGGLGAGKVTVTGKGIKKTTKTISKSTVATITARRTGKAKPGAFKVKFAKAKVATA